MMDDIHGLWKIKTRDRTYQAGLARMQKGGVIMDVTTPEQARISEAAGAVAAMALQTVPADIRRQVELPGWQILKSSSR